MTSAASDVFISYKAEERKRLVPLVEAFQAEGFSVWWDQHIGGGTNWREEIESHLDAARVVIVVWSKRSISPEGRFVRDEAAQAQETGRYLPITVDNVRPPLGFREIHALDLSSWWGKRDDPRFKILCETIRHRLEGKDIPRNLVAPKGARIDRRTAIVGGAGVAAVAAVGGWFLLKPAPASAKRIAVMDFDNLSGDPAQAYFAEGIAEELRSSLTRVGMQVIGRASCDAVKSLDIKAAAAKLGAANILTGSCRRSPAMIRVEAQLVGGSDGVEHWAQSYDRSPGDEIKIQTDIAENVVAALSVALGQAGRAALTLGGTSDSTAQDLILQARKIQREASVEAESKALALADAAIARDPNYADAYVTRASCLIAKAGRESDASKVSPLLKQSEVTTDRALALAPKFGPAHAVKATNSLFLLNFGGALHEIRAALALSPNDPQVLLNALVILPCFGEGQEALGLADRFIAIDPLNASPYRHKAEVLIALRRYADAVQAGRKALQIQPNDAVARHWIGDSLLLMGRYQEALANYAAMPPDNVFRLTGEAITAARMHNSALAERLLAELKQQNGLASSYQYAEIHAQLGHDDQAFAELDNAIAAKDPGLSYLKTDAFIDPIRSDRRYATLLTRLNFP
jgi:serine/threonine-protein kinase